MEIEPGIEFELTRDELEQLEEPVDAGSLESTPEHMARSVVAGGTRRMSALLAAPGEIKRVDFWAGGTRLVAHAYREERDQPCPGSVYEGRESGLVAISKLLSFEHVEEEPRDLEIPERFETLGALVEHVTRPPIADGAHPRLFVLNPSPGGGDPDVLIVVGPRPLWWALARQDETIRLSTSGVAQMWAHVIAAVDMCFGARVG